MIRRIAVNTFLLVFFGLLIAAASLPLVTQLQFDRAKRLEISYRWTKAKETYFKALSLNPLNADFFTQTGDFLLRQSVYSKNEEELFKGSEYLYQRASQLNPKYGYYRFLLGKIQLELGNLKGAIGNFKTAAALDPYNSRTNYFIGVNLLSTWGSLNEEEKDFTLTRLKYSLKVRPDYSASIYQYILFYVGEFNALEKVTPQQLIFYKNLYNFTLKNKLVQYRKELHEKVNFYRQKEEPDKVKSERAFRLKVFEELKSTKVPLESLVKPQDWQGNAEGHSRRIFEDGNMYWSGTINTVINMPKGKAEISIEVRGTPAGGVYPYMIVELEGEEIGETVIDSEDWRQYAFVVNTDGGTKVLSVIFTNDGNSEKSGEDRNLFIGNTRIVSNE
ncbi:carbohydrate-binding domain-containing protein [Candidatus Omnitrophota bacterium]